MSKQKQQIDSSPKPVLRQRRGRLHLFGSVRTLAICALLAALSFALAYVAKAIFGTGPYRITFENLPIIFGAFTFGPVAGGLIALCADLLSCALSGMAPSPLITGGAVLVGLVSGLCYRYLPGKETVRMTVAVFLGHLLGSMLLKSAGLYLYYGAAVFLRIPLYLVIAALEATALRFILKNPAIRRLCKGERHDV